MTNTNLKAQIYRVLGTFLFDSNDDATRSKIKHHLESSITGSVVMMLPVDPVSPASIRGTLNHPDMSSTFHFQVDGPLVDVCLLCGEALSHIRRYGCVSGAQNCPYETT